MTLQPPGLRIFKTALSVFLCLLIAQIIGHKAPIYACVAAILATRSTVENSVSYGITRIVATLIGAAMGGILLFFDLGRVNAYLEIALLAIGCFATLYVCTLLKVPDAAALSCIIFLSIVLQNTDNKYYAALVRLIETVAGLVVSILVNKFVGWREAPDEDELEPPDELTRSGQTVLPSDEQDSATSDSEPPDTPPPR
ncbi:aromatic acid exporter family protein [Oscillospiraceae bacterium OttesenSCG-928-G22]|nr:aromatic acid exporter family protein [Oscillospiraceae bacterium OttesenSCG-928-G22]